MLTWVDSFNTYVVKIDEYFQIAQKFLLKLLM